MPRKTLLHLLSSPNPNEQFSQVLKSLKKKGFILNKTEGSRLQGKELLKLRKQYGINVRKNPNVLARTQLRAIDLLMDRDYQEVILDDRLDNVTKELLKTAKQENNPVTVGRAYEIVRRQDKGVFRAIASKKAKIKKDLALQRKGKTRERALNVARNRDEDPFINRNVSRLEHAPRAGNRTHPKQHQKQVNRVNRAIKREENAIYTENQCKARMERRDKKKARRKLAKFNQRSEVVEVTEKMESLTITPESWNLDDFKDDFSQSTYDFLSEFMEHTFEAIKPKDKDILTMCQSLGYWLKQDPIFPDFMFNVTAFANWTYQLYCAKNKKQYFSACYAYAQVMGVTWSNVKNVFRDIIELMISTVTITPESDFGFLGFEDFLLQIQSTQFVKVARTIALTLISYKLFSKDISEAITSVLGKPPASNILDIIRLIYESMIYIYKFSTRLLAGERFSEILWSDDPISKAISRSSEFLKLEEMTYSGLPIDGFVNVVELYTQVKRACEDMEQIKEDMSRLDTRAKTFAYSLNSMYKLANRLETSLRTRRTTPFAIVIHGPPGVGKSELVLLVAQWFSHVYGRDFEESHIFNRSKTSNYLEGYSHSTPIMHYSELGNIKANLVINKGDPLLPELQSVIDALPYNADMAFADKGKMHISPELVIIDTNNKLMNADVIMYDPGAFLRRFVFMEVRVREEFRVPGGVGLDKQKSLADDRWIMDRYDFNLTKFKPTENRPIEEVIASGDIYVMKETLERLFREHAASAAELKQRIGRIGDDFDMGEPVGLVNAESLDLSVTIYDKLNYGASLVAISIAWMFYFMLGNYLSFRATVNVKIGVTSLLILCNVLAYYGWLVPILILLLTLYTFFLFFPKYKPVTENRGVLGTQRELAARLRYYLYQTPFNPFLNKEWYVIKAPYIALGALLATISVAIYAYTRVKKDSVSPEGRVSDFQQAGEIYDKWNALEQELDIHPTRIRVKGTSNNVWNEQLDSKLTSMVNTHSAKDLYRSYSNNVRVCEVQTNGKNIRTHILGVSSTFALINKHALHGYEEADIFISESSTLLGWQTSSCKKISIKPNNYIDLGTDLLLFDTGYLHFKDLTKHLLPEIPIFKVGSGTLGNVPITMQMRKGLSLKVKGELSVMPLVYQYSFPAHGPGICGLPVILDNNGTSAVIGIHVGGLDNTDYGFAVPICKGTITNGIRLLKDLIPYVPVCSKGATPEHYFVETARKSPFKYETFSHLDYYGKLDLPILINNKTNIVRIAGHKEISQTLIDAGIHCSIEYRPAMMKPTVKHGEYVSPYNNFLNKINSDAPQLNQEILGKCIELLKERIISKLRERGVTSISSITLKEAINGIEHDPFTRRVNASTASGYGYSGKKIKHLPIIYDEIREPTPEVLENIVKIIESYRRDESVSPICEGALKDELRTKEKSESGSTRVFFISQMDSLLVARMFLSSFYTLMVEHGDIFGTAVGINMHTGIDKVIKKMFEFSPLIFEGDYKAYDVNTPLDIARAANTVVHDTCKELGYTEIELAIVRGIQTDDLFPLMELNTDVFTKPGVVTSGRYATAESNSLRGLIYLMYAWYSSPNTCNLDFFEFVLVMTYGDDVLAAVKPEVSEDFNIITYSDFCLKHYNMEFTSPTKGANNNKFVDTVDCTFLKRTFKLHETGIYIAPLDPSSIHKALTWVLLSRSVTVVDQLVSCFTSMLYEVFFHVDEAKYNTIRDRLKDVLCVHYLVEAIYLDATLPTFGELYNKLIVSQLESTVDESDHTSLDRCDDD